MKSPAFFAFAIASAAVATTLPALAQSQPATAQPAPAPAPPPAYPYAPPYPGYPGYGYPPPYPGYTSPAPPPPPTEMRAVDGRSPPEGYHVESHARRGLVLGGGITLGVMYGLSASVAAQSQTTGDGWLFVPVFGPFLDLSARKRCDQTGDVIDCVDDSFSRVMLTFDGIAQIAGAVMVVVGVAAPKTVWVRDDAPVGKREPPKPTFALAPMTFGRTGVGLGAGGEFF